MEDKSTVDFSKLTQEQLGKLSPEHLYVMKRFSSMVREIITLVETWFPQEQAQRSAKRIVYKHIYDCRNDIGMQLFPEERIN